MEKLKMKTPDMTEKNIEQIAKIFPHVITEIEDLATKDTKGHEKKRYKKAIDFDLLRQSLSDSLVEDENERYRLDWPGKKASLLKANIPITKTLRPVRDESVNFDTTENLYIEGDNFEVLKILQESYLGKIKMIYIDPPYNTGKDFIYKDNFKVSKDEYEEDIGAVDEEGEKLFKNTDSNGRFHSDWLSMMYERLIVARDLLKDDGVIFISIDDNEVHNLRKVCDEIFGEENFRNTILTRRRIKSLNSQFASNGLYSMNIGFEYVLCIAKSSGFLMKALRMKKTNAPIKGRWDVFWSNADRPTMRYDILGFTPRTGQWRTSKEKADIAVSNYQKYMDEFANQLSLEEYSKQYSVTKFIRRIPNGTGKNGGVQHWIAPSDTTLRTSNWTDIEVSQIGKEINLPFDNPKSKQLIKELIKLAGLNHTDIILDFFSGSATTAHAVMQLNAEDNGNRKFIMVQLPEKTNEKSEAYKAGYKTIAEIGKERIRRAGKKIKEELATKNTKDHEKNKGEKNKISCNFVPLVAKKDLDIGFRVYKTSDTNMKDVYYHPEKLGQQQLSFLENNIKEDRTPDDLLTQVILDLGLELSLPIEKKEILGNNIFIVQTNALVACFDSNINLKIIDEIANLKPFKVVFKDAGFSDDKDRINLEERFKRLSPETFITVI